MGAQVVRRGAETVQQARTGATIRGSRGEGMIRRGSGYLCVLAVSTAVGFAQTPPAPQAGAAAPQGAGRGGGGAVRSPEITADGKVTFRLRAPNAKEVGVRVAGKTLPMEKNEQGVWSATSDVL